MAAENPQIATSLFQIRAHEIDKILRKFRCNLFFCAVIQVKPNMRLEHFCHQAIYATAQRGKQHQLLAAVLVGGNKALHSVQLSAQPAHPLQEFHLLSLMDRHGGCSRVDNTHPGYSIYR